MLLLSLAACLDCWSPNEMARDECLQERAAAAPTPTEVRYWSAQIGDPMTRDVAILLWVDQHHKSPPPGATTICQDLMLRSDQAACTRRFSAAHLNR